MTFVLLCREDVKEKIEKLHLIEQLQKEKYQITNIVTLPLAQWAGKVDEVFLIPYESTSKPLTISFS